MRVFVCVFVGVEGCRGGEKSVHEVHCAVHTNTQTHLLELHDVRVHQRAVVHDLTLHVLGDL